MKKYITVHGLGTYRYQLLEKDGVFYLRDHDLAWWGIMFAPLQWMFPQKLMKINLSKEEIFEKLIVYVWDEDDIKKRSEGSVWNTVAALFGASVAAAFMPLILQGNVYLSLGANITITVLIIMAAFLVRFFMYKGAEKKIERLPKESLVKVNVFFYPCSFSQCAKVFFMTLFIMPILLVGLFGWIGSESGASNGLMWLIGFIGVWGLSMIGVQTEFGENKARVTFKKNKSGGKRTNRMVTPANLQVEIAEEFSKAEIGKKSGNEEL